MIKFDLIRLIKYMSENDFKHFDGLYGVHSEGVITITFCKTKSRINENYICININKVISVDSWLEDDLEDDSDNISIECKNESDLYNALEISFAK